MALTSTKWYFMSRIIVGFFFVLLWVYRDFICLFCFSLHLECFMDHDSAVPAQMFFIPEASSTTSHFSHPPLYCLCTLHLSCDSYSPMSLVYMLYLPTSKLCKVTGQVTLHFLSLVSSGGQILSCTNITWRADLKNRLLGHTLEFPIQYV